MSAPGAPQNLEVKETTAMSITLNFDLPLENPGCAIETDIRYVIKDGTEKVPQYLFKILKNYKLIILY